MEELEKIENDYQDLIVEIEKLQRENEELQRENEELRNFKEDTIIYINLFKFKICDYANQGKFPKPYPEIFIRELKEEFKKKKEND